MNKSCLMFGIVIMLICVGLSGCIESVEDTSKFLGKWILIERFFEFDFSQYGFNNTNYTDFMDESIIFYSNGTSKWDIIAYYQNNTIANQSTSWSNWEVKEESFYFTHSNNETFEVSYLLSKNNTLLYLYYSGYMTSIYSKSNDLE